MKKKKKKKNEKEEGAKIFLFFLPLSLSTRPSFNFSSPNLPDNFFFFFFDRHLHLSLPASSPHPPVSSPIKRIWRFSQKLWAFYFFLSLQGKRSSPTWYVYKAAIYILLRTPPVYLLFFCRFFILIWFSYISSIIWYMSHGLCLSPRFLSFRHDLSGPICVISFSSSHFPVSFMTFAMSCLVLSCLALPCLAWPGLAWPGLVLPCLVLPCLALPCLALSFLSLLLSPLA